MRKWLWLKKVGPKPKTKPRGWPQLLNFEPYPYGCGSKLNHQTNRRFQSMFPFTRLLFAGYPIFDPQPYGLKDSSPGFSSLRPLSFASLAPEPHATDATRALARPAQRSAIAFQASRVPCADSISEKKTRDPKALASDKQDERTGLL